MRLPIDDVRKDIETALRSHRVVILTGATGSGKSTQLGKILLEMGETAIITQPRRLTAVALAKRVAEEVGCQVGTTVGYRLSGDKNDSEMTDLLFSTEGLTLIRELLRQNDFRYLCIDDIHEWGVDAETLLAWVKYQLQEDKELHLVIMSATLDTEPIAAWFNHEAAVIHIPGIPQPVDWQRSHRSTAEEAAAFLDQGKDVLVFEPGKKEIEQTCNKIAKLYPEAVILPLHAELTETEQRRCHDSFSHPKCIVATSIAQAGLTFPGIVVVDSGMERQTEMSVQNDGYGVETLTLRPAAQDTLLQRAGRTGRTEPGTYVLCSNLPFEERPRRSTPEIQRSLLEKTAIRLKLADVDMEGFDFLHAPSQQSVVQAKQLLRLLGAFDEQNSLTPLGKRMALLPVSPRTARMLIEANQLGVLDDMATCVSIIEEDGIVSSKSTKWHAYCKDESESDVLAQLAVWKRVRHFGPQQLLSKGVVVKAFFNTLTRHEQIIAAFGKKKPSWALTKDEKRKRLVRCIASGMLDQVFRRTSKGNYQKKKQTFRASNRSVCAKPAWIVGRPRNLQEHSGGSVAVVTMMTKITPQLLIAIAPQYITERSVNPKYKPSSDQVEVTVETWFDGHHLQTRRELDPDHPLTESLRAKHIISQLWREWKRPEISLPDLNDPGTSIPEIVISSYGTHPIAGEELPAYGILKPRMVVTDDLNQAFRFDWVRDLAAAREHRQASIERLSARRSNATKTVYTTEKAGRNAALMRAMAPKPR